MKFSMCILVMIKEKASKVSKTYLKPRGVADADSTEHSFSARVNLTIHDGKKKKRTKQILAGKETNLTDSRQRHELKTPNKNVNNRDGFEN